MQRGAQSVVQPLPSPGREWNDWEMALKGTGVGGVFTGLPESPAPSSCIQSVTRGTFPLPTGDCGGQGSQASACVLSCFSCARLFVILWTVAARLLCRWDSPGKNTGVGCHALLQGIFPNPEIKTTSVMPPALSSLPPVPPGKPPGPGVDPCEGWGGVLGVSRVQIYVQTSVGLTHSAARMFCSKRCPGRALLFKFDSSRTLCPFPRGKSLGWPWHVSPSSGSLRVSVSHWGPSQRPA